MHLASSIAFVLSPPAVALLPRRRLLLLAALTGPLLAGLSSARGQDAGDALQYPVDVVADDAGTIYVADLKLPGVWKIADGERSLWLQAEKRFRTPLNAIRSLAISSQGVLAGDSATTAVYRIVDGKAERAHEGRIGLPMAIAVSPDRHVLVADLELHRIWRFPLDGGRATVFAEVPAPRGLAVDKEGRVWVVSHGKDQVLRFSADGKQRETVVAGRPFRFPHHIAVDDDGVAYVADGYAKTIWKFTDQEAPAPLIAGPPLTNPVGIAISGDRLLVTDSRAKSVFAIDKEGKATRLAPSE